MSMDWNFFLFLFSTENMTLYHEMVSRRFILDMIHQVQLDMVKKNITISGVTQLLFEGGQSHHVNSHPFTCDNDIYSCTWELETCLLKPVSTNRILCQAMYNGSHMVIPEIWYLTNRIPMCRCLNLITTGHFKWKQNLLLRIFRRSLW